MQSFNALDRLAPEGSYGPAGEVRVVPDPETFTVLPYDDRAALLLADLHDLDGEPWAAGPRAQLRRYLDDLADDGYTPRVAYETEFYYTREVRRASSRSTTAPASPPTGCGRLTMSSSTRWTRSKSRGWAWRRTTRSTVRASRNSSSTTPRA
jgi:Glutamine synthetase